MILTNPPQEPQGQPMNPPQGRACEAQKGRACEAPQDQLAGPLTSPPMHPLLHLPLDFWHRPASQPLYDPHQPPGDTSPSGRQPHQPFHPYPRTSQTAHTNLRTLLEMALLFALDPIPHATIPANHPYAPYTPFLSLPPTTLHQHARKSLYSLPMALLDAIRATPLTPDQLEHAIPSLRYNPPQGRACEALVAIHWPPDPRHTPTPAHPLRSTRHTIPWLRNQQAHAQLAWLTSLLGHTVVYYSSHPHKQNLSQDNQPPTPDQPYKQNLLIELSEETRRWQTYALFRWLERAEGCMGHKGAGEPLQFFPWSLAKYTVCMAQRRRAARQVSKEK